MGATRSQALRNTRASWLASLRHLRWVACDDVDDISLFVAGVFRVEIR